VRQRGASIDPDTTVVAIAPDMGERYLNSIYDDSWVVDRGLEQALEHEPQIPKGSLDVLV
jgi:cysteine synthase A